MPIFQASQTVARPPHEVFDFFARPANLVLVSPPELNLQLEQGPERLTLGARVTVRGRRWGVPQRIVSQVTAFDEPHTFTDEQVEGPFKKFVHTHRIEAIEGGSRVSDTIEFEPPGGLLGLVVSASAIERELKWVFEYRHKKIAEVLE